jgi:hypothetical protein
VNWRLWDLGIEMGQNFPYSLLPITYTLGGGVFQKNRRLAANFFPINLLLCKEE